MYCELHNNHKRRTCKPTQDMNKNSNECKYNSVKKKCAVKKTKAIKTNSQAKKVIPNVEVKNSKKSSSPTTKSKSPSPKQISKFEEGENVKKYQLWCSSIDDKLKTKIKMKKMQPKNNESKIEPKTIAKINYDDVPEDAISIISFDTYKSDDDFKLKPFCKISTCKNCSNNGIFAVEEINQLVENNFFKCMICKEPYDMKQLKMEPPFGTMELSKTTKGENDWYVIEFTLQSPEFRRIERAFYPVCDKSKLVLWLLIEAWKQGKLFRIATSITTGKRGIVFAGIHLRTRIEGGFTNHGYSNKPKEDIEKILHNMISECNANDIFTPQQLDAF